MSTDHQRYSTENQAAAIAAYAAERNMMIVRTYEDSGRSGVRIAGRGALQALIAEVRSGRADFEFILVYDVSRWGRFQDADESAYYEFVCKEAGVQVRYCAEQFENDGSLASTILKNLKRVMAGEYSRELSSKVFIGQCHLAKLGFSQGGSPPYGLRRLLLEEGRTPKGRLERGQQKSIQTDRVILQPGPPTEIAVVRRIFTSFVEEHKSRTEIAGELNAEGLLTAFGNPWTNGALKKILISEKYIGNNTYNRSSLKLQQKQVVNPPDMWIRSENAFQAIIHPDLFAKAQAVIAARRAGVSDWDMLDHLSALWCAKGTLSAKIIDNAPGAPFSIRYYERFGSLLIAYARIGFRPPRRLRFFTASASFRAAFDAILKDIAFNVERLGGTAALEMGPRLLTINGEFTVAIGVAWCSHRDGQPKWIVHFSKRPSSDLCLIIRMEESNKAIRDYYVLPTIELRQVKVPKLLISNSAFAETYRHENLEAFYRLCARDELGNAA